MTGIVLGFDFGGNFFFDFADFIVFKFNFGVDQTHQVNQDNEWFYDSIRDIVLWEILFQMG